MKSTELLRKYRSGDVVIKSIKRGRTKGGKAVIYALISSATNTQKVYKTWITIMKDGQNRIPPNVKVHVQCECDDYIYMWEYANAAHNAAQIFYGNGEAPDEKNPAQKPGLCKHAYNLALTLLPNER